MARLQFRSATQSKGFAPIQLSKASLSEMEKRDAKLLKALESKHAAEIKQRETNLQAMRENAAYTERANAQNRQIELDNLQREQTSLNQIAERDRQQAQYDQQATETIINSIVDFSATAAKTAARNTAKQLEDQTALAMGMDLNEIRSLAHKEGINLSERSGIQASSLIQREDAQAGVPPHKTLNKLFGERGLGLVGQEVLYNRLYESDYNIQLNKNLQNTEQNFQLPNGRKFSGAEVENSQYAPEMLRVIQSSTRSQVDSVMRTKYGITEAHFFTDARGNIEKQNSIRESQYATKAQQNTQKRLTDIGDELIFDRPQTAYERYKQAGGFSLANKKFREKLAAQPDPYKREELGAVVLVDNNGKSTTWKEMFPNQFAAASVKAEEAETQRIAEAQRQRQVDYNQLVITNQDNYIEAYRQNPAEAARLVRIQAREVGNGTIHPIITQIESAQLKVSTNELEKKIADGSLSLSYVNSLPITLRKQGITAYTALREQKYGTDDKDITDGMISTARDLTGIVGDGPNSVQTLQVRTALDRLYVKKRQTIENPKEAWNAVLQEVEASKNDPKGQFYVKVNSEGLNKITLPNIQKPSRDLTERLNYVQKKMLEVGTDAVNLPLTLDDSEGMDNTYKTSQTPGQMVDFGIGIREFADRYGFTYAEVFNAQRKANNAALGENKPLIGQSVLDEVKDPNIRRLIFNGYNNKTRSLRGAVMQDNAASGYLRSKEVPAAQGGLTGLTNNDYSELAFVAGSEAGPGDDVYAVVASILNRAAKTGRPIAELIREPGQYQPVYEGTAKYDPVLAQKLSSPEGQRKIRSMLVDLEGRTDFKGTTQRQNMGQGDKLYNDMGNFYHYAGQRAGGGIYTGPIDRSYEKYYSN